jgi:hypothetical protein
MGANVAAAAIKLRFLSIALLALSATTPVVAATTPSQSIAATANRGDAAALENDDETDGVPVRVRRALCFSMVSGIFVVIVLAWVAIPSTRSRLHTSGRKSDDLWQSPQRARC